MSSVDTNTVKGNNHEPNRSREEKHKSTDMTRQAAFQEYHHQQFTGCGTYILVQFSTGTNAIQNSVTLTKNFGCTMALAQRTAPSYRVTAVVLQYVQLFFSPGRRRVEASVKASVKATRLTFSKFFTTAKMRAVASPLSRNVCTTAQQPNIKTHTRGCLSNLFQIVQTNNAYHTSLQSMQQQ